MTRRYARLEPAADGGVPDIPWYRSPRARLFGAVFAVVFASGCLYTLLQDSTWRSTATVLMSAPFALGDSVPRADTQTVAIQSRRLLGSPVTTALSERLLDEQGIELTPAELDDILSVDAVADTNLVEMVAEGSDGGRLPALINSWIDVYLAVRAEEVARQKDSTLRQVDGEMTALQSRLQQARDALDAYREEHDIVSARREENDVLAQLEGLNRALNDAVAEEVRAGAYLETLRLSIRRGERVIPEAQRGEVQTLERELGQLQAEMVELENRYTAQYIDRQPKLRAKVERIEELQAELAQAYERGSEVELAQSRQVHAAALQTVEDLKEKLAEHRERVSQFTRVYETHEALVQDLARLEELNREAQAREVMVSVQDLDNYPPVSVVQRPEPDSKRIGPDYLQLLGVSFGLAFVLGLLSVWLTAFLAQQSPSPTYVSVEVVPPVMPAPGALDYDQSNVTRLEPRTTPRLEEDDGDDKGR